MTRFWILTLLVGIAACAPAVTVNRMAYAPAKPPGCNLEVINGAMQSPAMLMTPNSPYEMLGVIATGQRGTVDPFAPEMLAMVGPRACELGGDAISLMMSAQSVGAMGIGASTGTGYVVLRKRTAVSSAPITVHAP
jgi:hypothetical protein